MNLRYWSTFLQNTLDALNPMDTYTLLYPCEYLLVTIYADNDKSTGVSLPCEYLLGTMLLHSIN